MFASSLMATSIFVDNFSFEADGSCGPFVCGAAPMKWTGSGGGAFATFTPGVGDTAPQDGANVAIVQAGNLSQKLTALLTAGTAYTLKVAVGSGNEGDISTYAVSLETETGTVLSTFNTAVPTHTLTTVTVNYTALAGNPHLGERLVIRLAGTPTNTANQAWFDNVRLDGTATIPEPSTIFLSGMAFGLLALLKLCRCPIRRS
jgi:hypothetical protein